MENKNYKKIDTIQIPEVLNDILENADAMANQNPAFCIELNPNCKNYTKNTDTLKKNILVIRETFKTICNLKMFNSHINMGIFYKSIGLQDYKEIFEDDSEDTIKEKSTYNTKESKKANDYFNTLLYTTNITSSKYYQNMVVTLLQAGMPAKYLCTSKITPFDVVINKQKKLSLADEKGNPVPYNLSELIENYIITSASKHEYQDKKPTFNGSDKNKILSRIDRLLYTEYFNGDPELLLIVTVCTRLIQNQVHTDELTLWKTTEALKDFMRQNMLVDNLAEPTSFIDSKDFADFITTLAETVNAVEEEFPEFYAVVQQMKEDKSAQSIMNEITNNLKALHNKKFTMDDVESDSCTNMMLKITELMMDIQNTISSSQQDAQEQAHLVAELYKQQITTP